MKPEIETMRYRFIALTLAVALTSCATLTTKVFNDVVPKDQWTAPGYYSGMRFYLDVMPLEFAKEAPGGPAWTPVLRLYLFIYCAIDVPLTAIADTAILPFEFLYRSIAGPEEPNERARPIESAVVHLPADDWKVGIAQGEVADFAGLEAGLELARGTFGAFIPESQSMYSWTEMVTVQFLDGVHKHPAALAMSSLAIQLEQCPELVWTVLKEEPNSVTYVWSISNCEGQDDQEELVRLLRGNDGLHRVAYTRKPRIRSASRSKWLDMLKGAVVVQDGEPIELNVIHKLGVEVEEVDSN